MMATAYLLLGIDTRTLKITGCGIFSEKNPTHDLNVFLACLYEQSGESFVEAEGRLYMLMEQSPYLSWALPLLEKNINKVE